MGGEYPEGWVSRALPLVWRNSTFRAVPIVVLIQNPRANLHMKAASMDAVERAIRQLTEGSPDSWTEGLEKSRGQIEAGRGAVLVETGEVFRYFAARVVTAERLRHGRKERRRRIGEQKRGSPLRVQKVAGRVAINGSMAKYIELMSCNEEIKEQIAEYYENATSAQEEEGEELESEVDTTVAGATHRVLIVREKPTFKYAPAITLGKKSSPQRKRAAVKVL